MKKRIYETNAALRTGSVIPRLLAAG